MRLGVYPCHLVSGTRAHSAYFKAWQRGELPGASLVSSPSGNAQDSVLAIQERHRHRFEFNNEFRKPLGAAGLVFSGLSPDGRLVEVCELRDHPFMLGSQFHPEFKSRPNRPHPLFRAFVEAAIACSEDGPSSKPQVTPVAQLRLAQSQTA